MSKPKLLLADDSITIQKVVNLTFADQGMDVFSFSDGDKAIELFDEINPDVVLADVHMPGIDGYQLCELLKSDASTKNIPVVLLVGSFEPFDSDEADRVGASTHLTKPFSSIADLVSTVQGLLQKPEPAEPSAEFVAAASAAPAPDTSDIDRLYEQSFMETVELPRGGGEEIEFEADDIDDDEMIQTSYAEPDAGPVLDESLYEANEAFAGGGGFDSGTLYTETPAARSAEQGTASDDIAEVSAAAGWEAEPDQPEVSTGWEPPATDDQANVPGQVFEPAGDDYTSTSEVKPETADADYPADLSYQEEEPAVQPEFAGHEAEAQPVDAPEPTPVADSRDPFSSFASEPPANEVDRHADTVKFAFEDLDLLELPESPSAKGVEYTVPGTSNGREVVSLSPELVDLIVSKVIERMGKND